MRVGRSHVKEPGVAALRAVSGELLVIAAGAVPFLWLVP
jgi:hypothetical protein